MLTLGQKVVFKFTTSLSCSLILLWLPITPENLRTPKPGTQIPFHGAPLLPSCKAIGTSSKKLNLISSKTAPPQLHIRFLSPSQHPPSRDSVSQNVLNAFLPT